MKKIKVQKRYFTQLAGEYLAAGELFRQGFFASVTFGLAKSFDIFVSGQKGKLARIEVKASSDPYFTRKRPPVYPNDHKWHFNIQSIIKELDEYGGVGSNHAPSDKFYVFVTLCGDKPDYYVFEAQMIYNALRNKINRFYHKPKYKGRKPSGRWDLKLSDIFNYKQQEKVYLQKDNWNALRRYLN